MNIGALKGRRIRKEMLRCRGFDQEKIHCSQKAKGFTHNIRREALKVENV